MENTQYEDLNGALQNIKSKENIESKLKIEYGNNYIHEVRDNPKIRLSYEEFKGSFNVKRKE